jgi:hypothetical protein
MSEASDGKNPSGLKASDSVQEDCGNKVTGGTITPRDLAQSQEKPICPDKQPSPYEVVRAAWEFVKEPKHSNALIAILTFIIAVTGIAYTIFSALQWVATRESVKTAGDALIQSNRPWVGVMYPLEITAINWQAKPVPTANYVITIKNYGPSIALRLSIAANAVSDSLTLLQVQDQTCIRSWKISRGTTLEGQEVERMAGGMMFPSDSHGRHFNDDPFPVSADSPRFWIIGCITYDDQFGNDRQTRFANVYYDPVKSAKLPIFLYSFFAMNDAN